MAELMSAALVLGAGQVGTFTARRLVDDGAAVVAADAVPPCGFFARFGPPEVELAAVDVLDHEGVVALVRRTRADVVVLAAGIDAESCRRDPVTGWSVNARGAEVVGDAALVGGASRLVLVSSFAVYAPALSGPIPETAPTAPRTVYGRSKAAAETAVRRLGDQGLDVRIVRPCAVYGPGRPGFGSRSTRLVDRLLLAALGTGGACDIEDEEYMYVKDLARALSLVALDTHLPRQVTFNVGAGAVTDAHALLQAVERLAQGQRIETRPPLGGARRFPLDVSRIRRRLAFQPQFDIAAGLKDYLETVAAS
ncbi:NAD(P)-dependent oxidoreductase [Solirubrobacter taibaiensis]|nr:NAD(P)-dependent oxidoreductase [Solirubrobacter taibaiensis]